LYRFVQPVVSPRARGLSVRLNLNPDGRCNFECIYCDVARAELCRMAAVPDVALMMEELAEVLELIRSGRGGVLEGCAGAPAEYLRLGHVALSGDGEPTLCPVFDEVVEAVLHLRAQGNHGFFRVAVITNSSGLREPVVRRGLRLLTDRDEIWAKLDAGTLEGFQRVNRADVGFEDVMESLLATAKERPVVIQSLFPRIDGRLMPLTEQAAWVSRVEKLKADGGRIQKVQVYSASRPPMDGRCTHATLGELSGIAGQVRAATGLPTVVF
jgi:wyosine [tRNA(Phe)-imidazoG37] synthetase (radical SAM superfamily)